MIKKKYYYGEHGKPLEFKIVDSTTQEMVSPFNISINGVSLTLGIDYTANSTWNCILTNKVTGNEFTVVVSKNDYVTTTVVRTYDLLHHHSISIEPVPVTSTEFRATIHWYPPSQYDIDSYMTIYAAGGSTQINELSYNDQTKPSGYSGDAYAAISDTVNGTTYYYELDYDDGYQDVKYDHTEHISGEAVSSRWYRFKVHDVNGSKIKEYNTEFTFLFNGVSKTYKTTVEASTWEVLDLKEETVNGVTSWVIEPLANTIEVTPT